MVCDMNGSIWDRENKLRLAVMFSNVQGFAWYFYLSMKFRMREGNIPINKHRSPFSKLKKPV